MSHIAMHQPTQQIRVGNIISMSSPAMERRKVKRLKSWKKCCAQHKHDAQQSMPQTGVSVNSRIDIVFTAYCESHYPCLVQLNDNLAEDLYQETAVIVLELLRQLDLGTIPNQGKIYEQAESYLDHWVESQIRQNAAYACSCEEMERVEEEMEYNNSDTSPFGNVDMSAYMDY